MLCNREFFAWRIIFLEIFPLLMNFILFTTQLPQVPSWSESESRIPGHWIEVRKSARSREVWQKKVMSAMCSLAGSVRVDHNCLIRQRLFSLLETRPYTMKSIYVTTIPVPCRKCEKCRSLRASHLYKGAHHFDEEDGPAYSLWFIRVQTLRSCFNSRCLRKT